ncbi:polysaccharide deacetylase family protein, partial [Arsukibacterium sp.]|uniref:polysaccharide deacetylase family protein n=1 Tax=Arsukibacterium sp. TaxID=1977258 RepID=UPI002FD9A9F4
QRYFTPLPLAEAISKLKQGTLPKGAVAVTFDDGYLNNLEVALPILLAHDIQATCFIATGFADGSTMWNDIVSYTVQQIDLGQLKCDAFTEVLTSPLKRDNRANVLQGLLLAIKYLQPDQRLNIARQFARDNQITVPSLMMQAADWQRWQQAGMEIGAHTVNHPILASLDTETASQEINLCRQQLLDSGLTVKGFAYPNGRFNKDFTQRDRDLVQQAGFSYAVSTNPGTNAPHQDCFNLKRFTPWDHSMLKFHARLLQQHWRGHH